MKSTLEDKVSKRCSKGSQSILPDGSREARCCLTQLAPAGRSPRELLTLTVFAVPSFGCVTPLLNPNDNRNERRKPEDHVHKIHERMSVGICKSLRSFKDWERGLIDEGGYAEPALQPVSILIFSSQLMLECFTRMKQ